MLHVYYVNFPYRIVGSSESYRITLSTVDFHSTRQLEQVKSYVFGNDGSPEFSGLCHRIFQYCKPFRQNREVTFIAKEYQTTGSDANEFMETVLDTNQIGIAAFLKLCFYVRHTRTGTPLSQTSSPARSEFNANRNSSYLAIIAGQGKNILLRLYIENLLEFDLLARSTMFQQPGNVD